MTLIMCLGNRRVKESSPSIYCLAQINYVCLSINLSDTCWGTMLRWSPVNYLGGFQEGLTPLKQTFHQPPYGVNFRVIHFLAFLLMQPPLPSGLMHFLLIISNNHTILPPTFPTLKHTASAREPILLIKVQSQQDAHALFKNTSPVKNNK